MQKLIYIQKFINSSVSNDIIAQAPSVAGFYGVYTALKNNHYSLSYNVRFTNL